jgi:shikimate dehydrogenase
LALGAAGAKRVEVVARRPEQGQEAAALAGEAGMVATVGSVEEADLVVNATPVGMAGVPVDASGELPFGLEPKRLGPGQLVADLIYAPATTQLLASARARGAGTCNGLGMLVHQAARQLTIWTGRDAPIEVMSAAALRELGKRAEIGKLRELPHRGETGPSG